MLFMHENDLEPGIGIEKLGNPMKKKQSDDVVVDMATNMAKKTSTCTVREGK